jgi:hypothetical protein
VDFYLPEQRQLIQLSQRIENSSAREREFRAIEEMVKEVPIDHAVILSDTNEDDISIGIIPVKVQSITQWLLTTADSAPSIPS